MSNYRWGHKFDAMSDAISLELLSRQIDKVLERGRKSDDQHMQVLEALSLVQKTVVNLDRRLSDVKEELELTIKMEIGGRLANSERKLEERIDSRMEEIAETLGRAIHETRTEAKATLESVSETVKDIARKLESA